MVLADPAWLTTIGRIAGTILLFEVASALLIVLVLVGVLAGAAWWVQQHVTPLGDLLGNRAINAMRMTTRGTDRFVRGVAELHGRQTGIETAIRVLIFGAAAGKRTPFVPSETLNTSAAPPLGISPLMGFSPGGLPEQRETRSDIALGLGRPSQAQPGTYLGGPEDAGAVGQNGHLNGHTPSETTSEHAR